MWTIRLASVLLIGLAAFAQRPDFDFYPAFRNDLTPRYRREHPGIGEAEILNLYAAEIRRQGVAGAEISRRLSWLRTDRNALEADYWDRFYTRGESNFNREPNAFLVQTVKGLQPGAALDYAMGEGRNALYLASRGWDVSGFDPASAAVAMAQERARKLGLTLHAAAVRDSDYDFGRDRFDLILFSWSMPLVPIDKVLAALRPGGLVVMECAEDYLGRNGVLKLFDALHITHYEVVNTRADFYDRRETSIVRLIAKKE